MLWLIVILLVIIIILLGGAGILNALLAVVGVGVAMLFLAAAYYTNSTLFWIWVGSSIAILCGIFGYALFDWWRGRTRRSKFRQPLSDQRRALIEESQRVSDRVYRHHTGIYLAKGPRGGTRVFLTRDAAEKYASR